MATESRNVIFRHLALPLQSIIQKGRWVFEATGEYLVDKDPIPMSNVSQRIS